ncbi:MAG: glycosyltransferase family 2 protein [Clostridiales bacterium]|nr:glycosyltransferase family 2 protein [Clostridiales bacterium]
MMEKNDITIICPLYNAEEYIVNLHQSILMQQNVNIKEIRYVLTESSDQTKSMLEENHIPYKMIPRQEFSHSLVREREAMEAEGKILVFITQDVRIQRKDWLYELVKPIMENRAEACYSRQLCDNNSIEKYTREKNYPAVSRVVSKKDIPELGLNTFFFSDAASAIRKDVFVELNGYDQKELPISEDMYIAYKVIMKDYRIQYCAESEVIHSHRFTLKQQFERYRLTGRFFKENAYLDQYGTNRSGGNLAKYILKRALEERNIRVLLQFVPNMAARFIGMKAGKLL